MYELLIHILSKIDLFYYIKRMILFLFLKIKIKNKNIFFLKISSQIIITKILTYFLKIIKIEEEYINLISYYLLNPVFKIDNINYPILCENIYFNLLKKKKIINSFKNPVFSKIYKYMKKNKCKNKITNLIIILLNILLEIKNLFYIYNINTLMLFIINIFLLKISPIWVLHYNITKFLIENIINKINNEYTRYHNSSSNT